MIKALKNTLRAKKASLKAKKEFKYMGLKEWKKKFYPVRPTKHMSGIDAIKHSILKWEGLKPTVLKEFGLERNTRDAMLKRSASLIIKVFMLITPLAHCA